MLKELVDKVKSDVEILLANPNIGPYSDEDISDLYKVLDLLLTQASTGNISERVLRAMHDIGMYSYKVFEYTPASDSIRKLTKYLYDTIPVYKELKPLRGEFGKGDPI